MNHVRANKFKCSRAEAPAAVSFEQITGGSRLLRFLDRNSSERQQTDAAPPEVRVAPPLSFRSKSFTKMATTLPSPVAKSLCLVI